MNEMGRFLILAGAFLILLGVILTFAGKVPGLGKLPGDIFIKKENFSFYFPVTTSILLSLVLSLILYFFNRR